MTNNAHNPMHDPEIRRAYEEELLVAETHEVLVALVDDLGLSQRELAERLQVSEGRISQILSGGRNLTVRSLAGLGWALGVKFDLSPTPMTADERIGTPAASDPACPKWLHPKQVVELRWVKSRPHSETRPDQPTRKPARRTVGATASTARRPADFSLVS